jgi:hypothetical protein
MTHPHFTKFKTIVFTLILIISANQLFAQTSNGIFFQAVARDNFSNAAKDRKIFVQTSIIQSTNTGTKVLTEEHQANTDASGVFSITIGNGTRIGGIASNLASIDWSKGPFFLNLKVSITPISASSSWDYTKEWVDMGTTSFGAVPFSFYAANVAGFDTKLNVSDSAKMLSSYAKTTAINSLTTNVDTKLLTKLNIADSTKYVTPTQLAAKTFDQTPITNAIATKLNIADSTKYVTPTQLAAKTFDTTSISNRINLKLDASLKGTANGVASLNASGIIPSNQLPPLSLSSTSVVGSDADMIALSSATVGSIAIRTDVNKNYVLSALPASVSSNWIELLTPAAPVQTVNGYTGSINLTKSDFGLDNVDNTSDVNKPISNATKNALDTKAIKSDVDASLAQKMNITDASTALNLKANLSYVEGALSNKMNISDANAALNLKLDANKLGALSGVASLDASGKIPTDQIPAISFSSVNVLNNQADMLGLSSAVIGSVVIRTDSNKNFVLAAANPSVLSNWVQLLTPAPPVQSVNGSTGSVSITKSSIGLENVDNTSDENKPSSLATRTALGAKADTSSVNAALVLKANSTDVNIALATKASTGSLTTLSNTVLANTNSITANTNSINTLNTNIVLKAPIESPIFSGTVTTPSISSKSYFSTPRILGYANSTNTIEWSPDLGVNTYITLSQNSILKFMSAPAPGSYGTVVLTQDATGSRTLTLPTNYTNKILGSTSTTTVALTTAPNAKDILNYYYDGEICYWNVGQGYGIASTASNSGTGSGTTNLATGVTGTLSIANGGTGATTLTGLIKGNGTGALTAAVAGQDYQAPLTITTNGSGAATLSGTTLNIPSTSSFTLLNASGSTLGGVKVGNNLSIDGAGILSANINAGSISGTVSIANGGTSATTQQAAINALTGTQSSGKYLRSDGTNATLTNIQAGDVPTLNQSTTGNAATATTAGNITATSNTTLTSLSNLNTVGTITTGTISVTTNLKTTGTLTAGTVTYPNAHGNANQVLSTTGSGTLTWTSVSAVNIFSDEFTIATANQTVFNVANGGALTNTPLSSKVWMYINGTRISKTAYSVSGTTVTYDPTKNNNYALVVGDRIQFDYVY